MIVFLDYIYKGIGGVGQIVVNTTLELNRRGQKTKLYCSSESYQYQRLLECEANFLHINSDVVSISNLNKYLDKDDVLFLTHIDNTPLLEKIKKKNNRLIFYSVIPDTFFCYGIHMNWLCNQKKAALDFINVLYNNKALYFMDGPNIKAVYSRGGNFIKEAQYLPVPVISYTKKIREYAPSKKLHITYLGRGNSEWKVYPLIKVIEDLKKYGITAKLSIITDVNDMFQHMIREFIPNNTIEIEYINNLYGDELEVYLYNNSSLHIAMGTSALEAAKLGIPTILIDFSKTKFPENYYYRWIFECEDYCLAGEIVDGVLPYSMGHTLDCIFDSISKKEDYKIISKKCLNYVNDNHSISNFIDILTSAIENTTMTTLKYCSTRFSKNMLYVKPIMNIASKIKHFKFRR